MFALLISLFLPCPFLISRVYDVVAQNYISGQVCWYMCVILVHAHKWLRGIGVIVDSLNCTRKRMADGVWLREVRRTANHELTVNWKPRLRGRQLSPLYTLCGEGQESRQLALSLLQDPSAFNILLHFFFFQVHLSLFKFVCCWARNGEWLIKNRVVFSSLHKRNSSLGISNPKFDGCYYYATLSRVLNNGLRILWYVWFMCICTYGEIE